MGLPNVMTDPELVASEYAMETAIWFFEQNGLFEMADAGVSDPMIKKISKRVNGGFHGLSDRAEKTFEAHKWLAVAQ